MPCASATREENADLVSSGHVSATGLQQLALDGVLEGGGVRAIHRHVGVLETTECARFRIWLESTHF